MKFFFFRLYINKRLPTLKFTYFEGLDNLWKQLFLLFPHSALVQDQVQVQEPEQEQEQEQDKDKEQEQEHVHSTLSVDSVGHRGATIVVLPPQVCDSVRSLSVYLGTVLWAEGSHYRAFFFAKNLGNDLTNK